MCTRPQLNEVLSRVYQFSKGLFGCKLVRVVLYGSYARGDYDAESDIDVMVLVDMSQAALVRYRKAYTVLASDLGLEYDILIAPVLQDKETFETWQKTIPFYQNVTKDGVIIGA